MKTFVSIFVLLILLTSCTSITPVDMTAGAADKAILFPPTYEDAVFLSPPLQYHVQILSVDGKEISGAWDKIRTPVFVTVGDHIISLRVLRPSGLGLIGALIDNKMADTTVGDLAINTTAGKSYLISADPKPLSKHPRRFAYSISEFSGTESPKIDVDY